MPFFDSRGRRLYYERQGTGPAVLFCHGAGSNAATWWQQLPPFAARHTCITMDIRCFGRSVAPLEELSLDNLVEDVVTLLDREEVQRVSLVGQSLGGFIGLRLALAHTSRVAAFVACDSSLALDHRELLDRIEVRRAALRDASVEQRSLGRWFLENNPEMAELYAQINHFNPGTHSFHAQWGLAMASLLQPNSLMPMAGLRQLSSPTLLLVGSEDPIVPLAVMEEVQALVRGSEVIVVHDAGHSAYFEKPKEFNDAVLDFIARRAIY